MTERKLNRPSYLKKRFKSLSNQLDMWEDAMGFDGVSLLLTNSECSYHCNIDDLDFASIKLSVIADLTEKLKEVKSEFEGL